MSDGSGSSQKLFQRACKVLPGGVSRNTIFRLPQPFYAVAGAGCYLTDIDGVKRIDFSNNVASLIHGHAFPPIVQAVTEQLNRGTAFGFGTRAEVEYAEYMCGRFSGFDKIRFVNSGSEAVIAAIKVSRAFTLRPKIAKVEGAYHGCYDYAEVSQAAHPGNWGPADQPASTPVCVGTPEGVMRDVVVIPFNDAERAIRILDAQAEQIACVLIDLLPHRLGFIPATVEFVQAIAQWAKRNNALLVFDEVITLRNRFRGNQADYPVKPDLTTMGKMVGGGFPGGAIAGRDEVMKVMDPSQKSVPVPHSGTFSANAMTMTAGRVAMEHFDQSAVDRLNSLGDLARQRIAESIRWADIPACVTGGGSIFRVHLRSTPPYDYRSCYSSGDESKVLGKLVDHLFESGIMLINTCSGILSTPMTEVEIERLGEAMLAGFKAIKPILIESQSKQSVGV